MLTRVLEYSRAVRQCHLDALFDLLRIPSISTLPAHEQDMEKAADWLLAYLRAMGLKRVQELPTEGFPVLYAEWLGAGPQAPTLLVYGHYDVQPVDPLDEWHTPPFDPTIVGSNLYCRGASDDKGQLFAVLAAIESWLSVSSRLPVNLKVLLEGEEEVLAPHLARVVWRDRELLATDAVLICDEAILDPQTPLIITGVRGNLYLELEVSGPAHDLHSGTFGGAVDNPFNVLVRLLAQIQDATTRRILIPGFYDSVLSLDDAERERLLQIPLTDEMACQVAGVPALAGEEGYTTLERAGVRPTFEIHGMPGGFTDPGHKTVIPARAAAKLSMRLVPDQDPQEITGLFEQYVRSFLPPTVQLTIHRLGSALPAVVDVKAPAVRAMAHAFELGFGAAPYYFRGGGSLPIVRHLQDALAAPVVLIGFGLPDDNSHAPNERLHLPNWHRGIETLVHYLAILGGQE